jgi:hypothetical protein
MGTSGAVLIRPKYWFMRVSKPHKFHTLQNHLTPVRFASATKRVFGLADFAYTESLFQNPVGFGKASRISIKDIWDFFKTRLVLEKPYFRTNSKKFQIFSNYY